MCRGITREGHLKGQAGSAALAVAVRGVGDIRQGQLRCQDTLAPLRSYLDKPQPGAAILYPGSLHYPRPRPHPLLSSTINTGLGSALVYTTSTLHTSALPCSPLYHGYLNSIQQFNTPRRHDQTQYQNRKNINYSNTKKNNIKITNFKNGTIIKRE